MKNKKSHPKNLENKIDNVFILINLASKRGRELASGSAKLIQTECNDPVQIALEEIAQRKINFSQKKISEGKDKKDK